LPKRSTSRTHPTPPSRPTRRRWRRRADGRKPLANETRAKAAAAAEARRKEADAKLNARIAEAEKTIAGTRSAAMGNVRSIASEAAGAIVERLTGIAPAGNEVTEAVSKALKR